MITPKQVAALKYMIFNAKNGTELSKRVLAFLIESSEELTKEVCLSLVADREGYTLTRSALPDTVSVAWRVATARPISTRFSM